MSILINKETRLLVQGITGNEGLFHTTQMVNYGTNVVAGVTPGKGGEWVLDGKVPVFDSVKLAADATGANCSVIFVPARFAADAMFEAADAGIPLIVCITEGVAVQDMMRVRNYLDQKKVRLVGPNCPGMLTPGESKVGIIPGNIAIPGNVGVVSRSGTLTYEVLYALKLVGMGASTCVGIGGDPVNGTNFIANGAPGSPSGSPTLLYNTLNGNLSFDPDGTGGTAAIRFAVLTGHPTLLAADILFA